MCGDNRKVRMHGNTVVSTYSWGFLFSLMTLVCKIPVGCDPLTTAAQPNCLQLNMAQEQRNYGTKKVFSDTFKLLR